MNRRDAELLATQYARRRIREGMHPADAARVSATRFGLSTRQEIRMVQTLRRDK